MVTEDAPAGAGQRTCGTHNVSCSRCIPVWTAGQASTAAVLLWATMLHYKAKVLPYPLIQQKARSCQHRSPESQGPSQTNPPAAGRKKRCLGSYNSEQEAAEAYDKAALTLRGPSAYTNFSASRCV